MQKRQNAVLWAVIISETSHIFCCVLPTVFTILSLLAGVGVFVMPASFVAFHDIMHDWELPVVVASGLILLLGWAVHWQALRGGECHTPGCQHHPDPAHPKRSKTHMILIAATVLFCINLFVFLVLHRGMGVGPEGAHEGHQEIHEEHEDVHDRGHHDAH